MTTGTGHLRVFSTRTGAPLLDRALGRPMFVPPITVNDDLAVTGWTRNLTIYRLRRSTR